MENKIKVLIVDDNPDHAELAALSIKKVLKDHDLHVARTSDECMASLSSNEYNAIILDYSLDGFNGLTILKYIKDKSKELPVIIVTGMGNERVAVDAMKNGAYDYIIKSPGYLEMLPVVIGKAVETYGHFLEKLRMEQRAEASEEQYKNLVDNINVGIYRFGGKDPWEMMQVNNAMVKLLGYSSANDLTGISMAEFFKDGDDRHVYFGGLDRDKYVRNEEYRMKRKSGDLVWCSISSKKYTDAASGEVWVDGTIEDITDRKKAEEVLAQSLVELKKVFSEMVRVLAATSEMRDSFTAGHQKRVAELACEISARLGFSEDRIEGIKMGALVHDIGKIHIPIEILSKPGKLTSLEYELIKTHPEIGFDILKFIKLPWPLAEMTLQHHERIDGSGYPKGLKKEEILLEARIISVCDAVEAMVSHRPYRPAMDKEKALKELSLKKGKIYDEDVVDACLYVFSKGFEFK
jgi:PAS domain S-box-containing protein